MSTAHLENGITVVRELSGGEELLCSLRAANDSGQNRKLALRMAVYRPVQAKDQEELRYRSGIVVTEGKTTTLPQKVRETKSYSGSPSWITSQGKSSAIVVGPKPPIGMFHVEHSADGLTAGWLTFPEVELSPGQVVKWEFRVYAGPMAMSRLKVLGMEQAISFGAFSGIAKLLLGILNWSKNLFNNYGLAVCFVSFCIWLLFFPMTWAGVRMMKVMSQIQPHVERIRKEHSKDPQRMNRELMELYKKHRVNPLSGCLPLFIQMPIFIALFQVLSRSAELKGAPFLWIKDLAAPDALVRFPNPVPLVGESLNLLPILMAAGMFVQQRMTSANSAGMSEEQRAQQKIFKWFPLLFSFLFYGLPSGLVLYWVVNTALTLSQYALFHRIQSRSS
ncbi:MAG: YidC/Oxa1 family insertase periplasmic-domain containing protein [Candidatus Omnitrophica bacterium]|nr:YidC/Oxa1 family insertase periplasmic-domain containing protein [Candidatus Omnitrophota bacterium]